MKSKSALFILVLLVFAAPAWAQEAAALSGAVQDSSGAVLPGVTVKLTSKAQGTVRQQITNEAGVYQFTFIPPGVYDIEATLPGFKTVTRTDLTLAVAQNARLDLKLEVGNVVDSVSVSANTEAVNTMSAELSTVVDNTRVVEMPLNGRTFYSLATLVPGVVPPAQGSSLGYRGGFNVSGSCEGCNYFSLNGIENDDNTVSTPMLRPSIDAIQEFTILTGVYPAQYGYGSGGQVIVTTKSGTNNFHGTVYNFLRNSGFLAARNVFQAPNTKIPSFKRNQFGATVGGPIQKDKTFFFYAYEGLRASSAVTALDTVPTVAMRNGDFSALLPRTIIRDPATGQPFPGNIIPGNRINPIGQALLAFYPDPTSDTPAGQQPSNNYRFSATRPENMNQHILKIDRTFSEKDSAFINLNYYKTVYIERMSVPSCGATALPGFSCPGYTENAIFGLSEVHAFSSRMINEVKVGYMHESTPAFDESVAKPFWSNYGITPLTNGFNPGGGGHFGPPTLAVTSYTGYANSLFARNDPHWQLTDNFSWTRSKHTIKIGTNIAHHGTNNVPVVTPSGTVTFTSSSSGPTSTYALADVLLGLPTSTQLKPNPLKTYGRTAAIAAYLQDDYKVNERLSLNLGLRWEMNTPPIDLAGHLTSFDPVKGIPFQQGTNGYGEHVYKFDWTGYAPRLGFSWQPTADGKTVVRGGAGTFYQPFALYNGISGIYAGYPVTITNTYTSSLTQPLSLSNPFPSSNAVTSNTLTGIDPVQKNPRIYEWSLGVQHQLTNDMLFEVSYMGSAGNHLRFTLNINQPPQGPGTPAQVNARRPFPNYGTINLYKTDGISRYNSLQSRLQQHYSHGLSFLLAYTFSHSIDDIGAHTNVFDAHTAQGPSTFDTRHRVAFSPVYELPFGSGKQFVTTGPMARIVGGWQVSPLLQWNTGTPLTPTLSLNYSNSGGTPVDRPDVIGNPNANAPHTQQKWFDTSVFLLRPANGAAGATYSFGNAGLGIIRAPSYSNIDVSIVRTFQPKESIKVQFRAELFNALNHTNFGFPNVVADNPQFGTISSALDPRVSQFALKIIY